ncbi:uncharacterized protein LOC129179360 isoform X2 [Dunckerocampus dactyliophorus]|nr:uncharacterized protein LOC129179360 isoform X2 [Dunckerocampus dactyliophorus]
MGCFSPFFKVFQQESSLSLSRTTPMKTPRPCLQLFEKIRLGVLKRGLRMQDRRRAHREGQRMGSRAVGKRKREKVDHSGALREEAPAMAVCMEQTNTERNHHKATERCLEEKKKKRRSKLLDSLPPPTVPAVFWSVDVCPRPPGHRSHFIPPLFNQQAPSPPFPTPSPSMLLPHSLIQQNASVCRFPPFPPSLAAVIDG